MYGLVPYNLSPIQQGIQFGHAVVEYSLNFGEDLDYKQWARKDKTFIILNGGTTNLNEERLGSLNQSAIDLTYTGSGTVKHATFHEPDLGDQLTAVVFLVDDRVWNKKLWPDYEGNWTTDFKGTRPDEAAYEEWVTKFSSNKQEAWRIVWLREYLKNFRLA